MLFSGINPGLLLHLLSPEEFREGGPILTAKVELLRPQWLAVAGVAAYRTVFANRSNSQVMEAVRLAA